METARTKTLLKQRVAKAIRDSRLALDEGWYQDPAFLLLYFDRSEDEILHLSPRSFELAHRAVKLACRNGDPCGIHRAYGLLSHAFIVRGDLFPRLSEARFDADHGFRQLSEARFDADHGFPRLSEARFDADHGFRRLSETRCRRHLMTARLPKLEQQQADG